MTFLLDMMFYLPNAALKKKKEKKYVSFVVVTTGSLHMLS
jgi:hypothetical protein